MRCPLCDNKSNLKRDVKDVDYVMKTGMVVRIRQPGLWCSKCNDGILSYKDIQECDRQLRPFEE